MRPPAFLLLCCLCAGGGGPAAYAADPPSVTPITAPASPAPAIGEETSLEALTGPQRFAWPARFTCRPDPRQKRALVVVGQSFQELNETLAAADILLEDCRGGFKLESVTPEPGKLGRIVGEGADDAI